MFADAGHLIDVQRQIQKLRARVKALAAEPVGAYLRGQQIDVDLKNAWAAIKFAVPYVPVPTLAARKNEQWRKLGWITKQMYERLPDDLRA